MYSLKETISLVALFPYLSNQSGKMHVYLGLLKPTGYVAKKFLH